MYKRYILRAFCAIAIFSSFVVLLSSKGISLCITNSNIIRENGHIVQGKLELVKPIQTFKNGNYNTSGMPADTNSLSAQPRMKSVVIVGGYRTGSSFIGQIFNQHPQMFYLFEPLYFNMRELIPSLNSEVMEELLLCNMTKLHRETLRVWRKFLVEQNEGNHGKKQVYDIERCVKSGICFREKSRALCTPDMCGNETLQACSLCPRAELHDIEKKCKQSQVRVMKVIRIYDLIQLKRSWENKNIDLKILHLVRDPRSTALSRHNLDKTKNLTSGIAKICEINAENHGHVVFGDEDYRWLKGIYKLVRYEDVIESPVKVIREIYNFINFLPVHSDVINWVLESTHSNDEAMYGTRRDVKVQQRAWRQKISLRDALDIQSTCDVMMTLLGYRKVQSEKQLTNIYSSLLETPVNVT